MESSLFKAYITKYCLTKGIIAIDAELTGTNSTMIIVKEESCFTTYYHKGEWFRTEEEAKADAQKRLEKRIKSLKATLKKLENIKF